MSLEIGSKVQLFGGATILAGGGSLLRAAHLGNAADIERSFILRSRAGLYRQLALVSAITGAGFLIGGRVWFDGNRGTQR